MPCGIFKNCATCHNFRPSLIIIMDDGDEYFQKKNPKIFIMPCVEFEWMDDN